MINHERFGTIVTEILKERIRQEELKAKGKFDYSCADSECTDFEKLAILGEEFGEVSKEVNELCNHKRRGESVEIQVKVSRMKKELIQTAAVIVAWLESDNMQ